MDAIPVHRRERISNYDAAPSISSGSASECLVGWGQICSAIRATGARIVLVDT